VAANRMARCGRGKRGQAGAQGSGADRSRARRQPLPPLHQHRLDAGRLRHPGRGGGAGGWLRAPPWAA